MLACIDAGKPVLCEKPLATTGEDALKVIEAEVALGRRLVQVGFMRRYDRAYRVVKAAMDDGSIGEPLLAHMVHRNASVPDTFTSDMSMTDSVVHEIDTIRWLFDQEIVATTVVASRPSPLRRRPGLRDPQLVLFELTDGAVIDVEVFVNCRYGYDVRCEVVGSEGTVAHGQPAAPARCCGAGRRGEAVPADWRVRFDLAYLEEMQEWVDGAARGRRRRRPQLLGRLRGRGRGRAAPCTPSRRARAAWSSRSTAPPSTADRRRSREPRGDAPVKIALDPYMFRTTPLLELPGVVADLGYEYIELSPREDFMPFFLHPRADRHTVAAFKAALDAAGVEVASRAAALPVVRAGRGRAPGGGALLEARDPDHRRPRLPT